MKIVLIHGIHQEEKSPSDLEGQWLSALTSAQVPGLKRLRDNRDIDFPYYGDLLAKLTFEATGKTRAFQRSPITENSTGLKINQADFDDFIGDTQAQMAAHGVSSNVSSGERGKGINKSSFKVVAKGIEKVSPLRGKLALKLLKQAYSYIKIPEIQTEVNDMVRPYLTGSEPKIIVAHSLGTIVAYKLILELTKNEKMAPVPLFMTLGSPLSLRIVMNQLANQIDPLGTVKSWVNAADKEDFVALGNSLNDGFYKMPIINITSIDNGHEDPHSIEKYLSHQIIAEHIAKAME